MNTEHLGDMGVSDHVRPDSGQAAEGENMAMPVRCTPVRPGFLKPTGRLYAPVVSLLREADGQVAASSHATPGNGHIHAADRRSACGSATAVSLTTLGRFFVMRGGEVVPATAGQSRKARDLLKLLIARRGRPITRDAAAEALWPEQDPAPLANRLSVLLSTVRRILDPARMQPADHFVAGDGQSLALRLNRMQIDIVAFYAAADAGARLLAEADFAGAEVRLRRAEQLYVGDFLEEDLYEEWAVDYREHARSAALTVHRLLARLASGRGDDEAASLHLSRLVERDPYDEDAWLVLIAAQKRLRRHGQALRHHGVYTRRMAELAVRPRPLAEIDAGTPTVNLRQT
jgi:DNA-binding SARP family transcriptional activator